MSSNGPSNVVKVDFVNKRRSGSVVAPTKLGWVKQQQGLDHRVAVALLSRSPSSLSASYYCSWNASLRNLDMRYTTAEQSAHRIFERLGFSEEQIKIDLIAGDIWVHVPRAVYFDKPEIKKAIAAVLKTANVALDAERRR